MSGEPPRAHRILEDASTAFIEERFDDAKRLIVPLSKEAPDVPEVRELCGLVLYRLGRWSDARRELRNAYALNGDVTNHPVLMDCERALGNARAVAEIWESLGKVSA